MGEVKWDLSTPKFIRFTDNKIETEKMLLEIIPVYTKFIYRSKRPTKLIFMKNYRVFELTAKGYFKGAEYEVSTSDVTHYFDIQYWKNKQMDVKYRSVYVTQFYSSVSPKIFPQNENSGLREYEIQIKKRGLDKIKIGCFYTSSQ
jgi:hypothetical protein